MSEQGQVSAIQNDKMLINRFLQTIAAEKAVSKHTLAAYQNDFALLHEFMRVLKDPYSDDVPDAYQAPPLDNERVYQTFCGT